MVDARLCLLALLVLPAALPATAAPGTITLVDAGRSDYRIVVPANAIPSEQHAASELQSFLKQISGAELPIVTDAEPLPARAILLGRNAHLERVRANIDFARLGQEGFTLRTVGPHLVIAGGQPRGTLYGVYTFLEEHLGCRWFSSKVSRIPKKETITLGAIDDTQVPVLEYREPFWWDAFDGDWAARNKANSNQARLGEKHGGKITYVGFVHTFNRLVPPEKYFDEHPEYFSEIGGKRMKGYYQLCLTNPDVLKIVIEGVRKWLRENPQASIVSVSQNDTRGYCECANCKKVEEEEGGAHSGPLIRFVNAVAEAIEKEFPHVAIDTLAYQYTRKPCKTRPRHNVIVRLCSIECCFSHFLAEEDTEFARDIEGWSKICNRLYIWDYTTTFAHYVLPFSNIEVLQPNVQFFVKNNVKGIFEQGAYQSPGADMAYLKAYLLAKILWNPNCDVERHRREFLEGFYGKAADQIDRYLRLCRAYVLEKGLHQNIWINPESGHMPSELVAQANALFDEAERAVADDPDALYRVRVARLPIQYVQLTRVRPDFSKPWRIRGDSYGPEPDPAMVKVADQFFSICAQEGVTHLSESRFSPEQLHERVAPAIYGAKLVTLENDALRLRVAPSLGGRILTIEEKATGQQLVSPAASSAAGFPYAGGSWDAAGFRRRTAGANASFRVDSPTTGNQVTLVATLKDGLELKRVIRLAGSGWTVETTVTNTADQPRAARIRSGLELAAGGEEVGLTASGKELALAIPADAWEARQTFTGGALPRDGWTLSLPAGHSLRCQVTGQLQQASFAVRAGDPTVTIHLLTPEKSLPPKESLALTTAYTLGQAPKRDLVKRQRAGEEIVILPDEFSLFREGTLSGLQEDPTAPEGFAVRMAGDTNEWATQWKIDPARVRPGATYEVSALVRFDLKGKEGTACTFGVYDVDKKAGACGGALAARDAKPGWQLVKFGRFKAEGQQYVWLAPALNPDNVGAVYVDRVFFRRVEE